MTAVPLAATRFRLEPATLVLVQPDGNEVRLITTPTQLVDERLLERRDSFEETDGAVEVAVEFWLDGKCVHRSAHVILKTGLLDLADLGGVG